LGTQETLPIFGDSRCHSDLWEHMPDCVSNRFTSFDRVAHVRRHQSRTIGVRQIFGCDRGLIAQHRIQPNGCEFVGSIEHKAGIVKPKIERISIRSWIRFALAVIRNKGGEIESLHLWSFRQSKACLKMRWLKPVIVRGFNLFEARKIGIAVHGEANALSTTRSLTDRPGLYSTAKQSGHMVPTVIQRCFIFRSGNVC